MGICKRLLFWALVLVLLSSAARTDADVMATLNTILLNTTSPNTNSTTSISTSTNTSTSTTATATILAPSANDLLPFTANVPYPPPFLNVSSPPDSYSGGYGQGCAITANNFFVCVGGRPYSYYQPPERSISTNDVFSSQIIDDSLTTWVNQTPYPANIYGAQCLSRNNTVFCFGGYIRRNVSYSPTVISSNLVYSANMSVGGVLGSWIAGNLLPYNGTPSCILAHDTVYCVGISSGMNDSYSAQIVGEVVGTWSVENTYPYPTSPSCVYDDINDRIDCAGGSDYFTGNPVNNSFTASLASGHIGTWTATTGFFSETTPILCVSLNGRMYCLDYCDINNSYELVYSSSFTSTGIGNWLYEENSTVYPAMPSCATTSSAIFCSGGDLNMFPPLNLTYVAQLALPALTTSTSTTTTTTTTTTTSTNTTTTGGGIGTGGGGAVSGGGSGGGGFVSIMSTISYTNPSLNQTGFEVLNFTKGSATSFSVNGKSFIITLNFITPTSVGVTVNGKSYTVNMGTAQLLDDPPAYNYFVSLVNVSYLPVLQSADIALYGVPQAPGVQTISTTLPTTTVRIPSTTSVATGSGGAAKVQQSVSQPLISVPVLEIIGGGIVAVVVAAFLYNKRRMEKHSTK